MTYLSRQGDVPLLSSESTFGVELGADDAAELAAAWGLPEADRGGADRTSHFVVSFPHGTDPGAAERAGRAWAAALFDSGAYGDRWDYYTAFHTDTAYPHIHVVVGGAASTRGSGCGSRRGELTFDRLREVQVEVAAREGIALTGTSRLSRGVHERPVPDAEYRRARAEGRAAVPPEHTPTSAVATEILDYARDYQGAAAAIRDEEPDCRAARGGGRTILAGRALAVEREAASRLTTKEAMRMAETISQIQAEVRPNFVELEAEIRSVDDPAKRVPARPRRAEGGGGADHPRRSQLAGLPPRRAARGLSRRAGAAGDARAAAIKAEADREVARLAERFGLQPEATLARFGRDGIGRARARLPRRGARRARGDRAARGEPAERVDEAAAQLADFHRRPARSTGRRPSGCASSNAMIRARACDRASANSPAVGSASSRGGTRPLGGRSPARVTWRLTGARPGERTSQPDRLLAASVTTTSGAGDDAARTGRPARRLRRGDGRGPAGRARRRRGRHLAPRRRSARDRSLTYFRLLPARSALAGPPGTAALIGAGVIGRLRRGRHCAALAAGADLAWHGPLGRAGELRRAGLLARRLEDVRGPIWGKLGKPRSRAPWLSSETIVHSLVAAPTGAGKGVGIVIPTLLTYPGSTVVLDVKGENYEKTARRRHALGDRVFKFAPYAKDRRSHRYNPFDEVAAAPERRRFSEALRLANSLVEAKGKGTKSWVDGAREIFAATASSLIGAPLGVRMRSCEVA